MPLEEIGHFRITFGLFFKASPGAHPFIWKLVFIHLQMKTNFHMKSWAPGLALKKKPRVIRKWPIAERKNQTVPLEFTATGWLWPRRTSYHDNHIWDAIGWCLISFELPGTDPRFLGHEFRYLISLKPRFYPDSRCQLKLYLWKQLNISSGYFHFLFFQWIECAGRLSTVSYTHLTLPTKLEV